VYPKHHGRPLFLAVGLTPILLHLTFQTQQCNMMGFIRSVSQKSRRYSFYCKAVPSKDWDWDWGPDYSVVSFSCFRELYCTGNGVTPVRWIIVLIIVSFHCTCANCGRIKNTVLIIDKVLNVLIYGSLWWNPDMATFKIQSYSCKELYILIYWMPFCITMYKSFTL